MQKFNLPAIAASILTILVVIPNALGRPWFPPHQVVYAETIIGKADFNGDGLLQLEEANEYMGLYGLQGIPLKAMDLNEDGNLTASEINRGFNKQQLAQADKNNDGLVTLYEMTIFLAKHGVHVQKKYLRRFDTDHDGVLSLEEVNQIPQKLFATPMDSKLRVDLQDGLTETSDEDIMKHGDLNQDGRLSLHELATALTDHGNFRVNAFDLIRLDTDHDGYISEDEIEEFRE